MATLFFTAVAAMVLAWAWQWWRRDATIVDIAWGLLVGAGGLWLALHGEGDAARRWLVGVLYGIWCLRLSVHQIARHRGEDRRYVRMRTAMGRFAQAGFFGFFMVQAGFVLLFALPAWAAANDPRPLQLIDGVGVLLWLAGFGLTTWSDAVLHRWRADPQRNGAVCRVGPWAWSRHPNYLGELLLWSSWPLLALASPLWWAAWLLPPLLYVLLRWLTGVPHVEREAVAKRGEAYRQYQAEVGCIFPKLGFSRRP